MYVAYVSCYLDQRVIACFAAVFIFCELNLIMKTCDLFVVLFLCCELCESCYVCVLSVLV